MWRRESAVAGTFYPRDPKELESLINRLCGRHPETKVSTVVAPHAGYIYSGQIAGDAYGRIEVPARVVILCPNHTGLGSRVSVWSEGSWETPLGDVPVAQDLAQAILKAFQLDEGDREAHLYEHAIEVHLPFLKWKNPKVRIVPIVLGALTHDRALRLGQELGRVIASWEEPVLVVASTDMSHYVSADEAKRKDRPALRAIESVNSKELFKAVVENEVSMCGYVPTGVALAAAASQGFVSGKIVSYGDSSTHSGDRKRVVSYASALIPQSSP